MDRFKIDFNPGYSGYSEVALFFRQRKWLVPFWKKVDSFESIEKAKDHYERIKDLPQYLP